MYLDQLGCKNMRCYIKDPDKDVEDNYIYIYFCFGFRNELFLHLRWAFDNVKRDEFGCKRMRCIL